MRGVRNLGEIQGSNFSSIAGFGLNDIGEQKIDLVNFKKTDNHPFKSLALETAVRL